MTRQMQHQTYESYQSTESAQSKNPVLVKKDEQKPVFEKRRAKSPLLLANRGRLLLRTPGPVPFGTCICSNVETILS